MSSIAGNTSTSETLSVNEVVTSTIDNSADADWFKVSLTTGLTYGFTVAGFGGPGIGMPDPDMFLYDPTGSAVLVNGSNGSSGTNSFSFSTVTTGTYFIGISDNGFADTGQYRLSWVATDTIVNNTNTTRVLGVGQTIASKIDVAQDSDWVKVTLTEGLSYAFVASAGGGSDFLEDADLFIRDANGNIIPGGNGSNGSTTTNYLSLLIQDSGTYFVEVSDNGFNDTGTYNLNWVATDNIVNNTATVRTLARNASVNSTIDVRQDADWFKVTLTEGLSYGFQVAGRGTAGLADGDLFLRDATGNIVPGGNGSNGSTSVNTLGYAATASGTYFIEVSDNSFNDIGAYVLRNLGLDTDFNNTSTDLSLRDGTRMFGNIDVEGDSDWVKFRAEQGVTYTFQLTGVGTADDLESVRLILRDSNGNAVPFVGQGSGETGVVTYTATTDSNLFLDVQGQVFANKGEFRLSVVSTSPTLLGTAAADKLTGGANNTVINGYGGNDVLDGGAGRDRLLGGLGTDTLIGGDGADTLVGAAGADSLSGGTSADSIEGGTGNDVLRGGLGADKFVFGTGGGTDTIRDFEDRTDLIEIESGASRYSSLQIRQWGDDVRVQFGTVTIFIENTDRGDISAADFLFT
jgi:serralysin